MYDVAIVGGGITGLTLGWNYRKRGKRIILLEKSDVLGGALQTKQEGDYLLEIGPNTVLGRASLFTMVSELGLDGELIKSQPIAKNRYLVCRDESGGSDKSGAGLCLQALKFDFRGIFSNPLLPPRFFGDLCKEPFRRRTCAEDESVRSFVTRRLGSYAADYLVAPLLSGIWAADTAQLSARSSLSKLWDLEQSSRSIILGSLFARRGNKPKKTGGMVSFRGGLQTLVSALAAKLGPDVVQLGNAVSSIEFMDEGVRLWVEGPQLEKSIVAHKVVLATDASETARLLRPYDDELADDIGSIPHAPVGVLHLAVARAQVAHPLDGFGFLVAPAYKKNVLGVIFSSSIFENRAPSDKALLTCFSGGMLNPSCADVTGADAQASVIADVKELLGISGDVQVLASNHYAKAIPNYPLGHYFLQRQVAEFCKLHPALTISANWLKGISVADRIDHAVEIAGG